MINIKHKLDNKKFYETNALIMPNFKKTMIRLNKKKFEAIKKLYPQTTKRNGNNTKIKLTKRSFSNNNNYFKFLESNRSTINKTPSKLISSMSMSDLTAKNYYNFESNNKFYKKIKDKNKNNNKINNSKNSKILLPSILSKGTNILNEGSQ